MTIETFTSKPLRWLGLLLVPALVAGGLLAANWGSDGRTRTVEAAVVNLDEPVTVNGTYTPLGRQLTAALVDSDRVENLSWVLASEDGAREGLNTGKYAAMVTIPREFSAAATSFGGDADKAKRATIKVETSPVAGIADATLGKVVAGEAAAMLNQTLTSTYLDAIYIGFNDMGDQFVTVADGAGELADGVDTYVDGVGQAADGAAQLADGADQLASGLGTMASQTKDLKKAPQLADGARQLADGLDTMATQTKAFKDAPQLGKGSRDLADGVKQYVGGVNQLIDQNLAALQQQAQLAAALKQFDPKSLQELSAVFASGSEQLSTLQALSKASNDALSATPMRCPDALQSQPGACDSYYAGVKTGLGVAAAGMGDMLNDPKLAGGMQQLQQLGGLLSSIDLGDGSDQSAQLEQLKAAGGQLVTGSDQVATQTELLTGGLPALATGIQQTSAGASELADGADELTSGLPKLADGIAQTASGASQLADGANDLADGLVKAKDGGKELSSGARQLADGLSQGKDQLPSYSSTDRKTLSEVVSQPIDTTNLVGTAGFNVGWASLLLVLALWLGALSTYVVTKAVSGRLLGSSRPTVRLVAESVLPGVVVMALQAVVVTVIGQFALQLPVGTLFAVFGVLLLAGVAFGLVNHALVAWFGGVGRLVSVALAVLGLASALTSAAPELFGVLRAFSPLSPALDAVRGIITGAPGVAPNVLVLVGWLILGLAASAIAVTRSRTTTFAALLRRHGLAA